MDAGGLAGDTEKIWRRALAGPNPANATVPAHHAARTGHREEAWALVSAALGHDRYRVTRDMLSPPDLAKVVLQHSDDD